MPPTTYALSQTKPSYQEQLVYTAINKRQYTVLYNTSTKKYEFKQQDGKISALNFPTKDSVIAFIRKNVSVPVKTTTIKPQVQLTTPVIIKKKSVAPVVKKIITPPATVSQVVTRKQLPKIDTMTKAS